ncbi:probable protein phosphatase 2C 59 [Selaginella moellendorffii]|nr:probable protein phosphatase 2C 59 [Selaginella moellendorffii]|eukprot:XP_002964123.2 probable protein phosphatase 2C 59 [Selaginella moellendorffii]
MVWRALFLFSLAFLTSSFISSINEQSPPRRYFGSATDQGLRRYQEDRILAVSNHTQFGVFGVFDGHGGAQASDLAASLFYPRFVRHLSSQGGDLRRHALEKSLRSTLGDVEDAVLGNQITAGSTACVAVVTSEFVLVANVGDSRALVCAAGSPASAPRLKAVQLSRDHHPEVPEERARIEAAGGRVVFTGAVYRVDGALAMSRAIGDAEFKSHGVIATPEFTEYSIAEAGAGSYLLLTSDGVFETMSNEEVCRTMGSGSTSLDEMASRIVRRALDRGSSDNVSVIVVPL